MAKWRIKEISDLTNVSVRMLHHYDKIGLLKPSMRTSSGYRLYAERDLAKLQQIIALKFFGFSLSQIKTMLQQEPTIQESLHSQQKMLESQVESLRLALDALSTVLQKCKKAQSLDWKHLIELIERYRMAEEIKNTWVNNLNEKQKERYLEFRQKYPKELRAWEKAVAEVNSGELGDPQGPDGERIAKTFTEYLRISTYNKSYKKERLPNEEAASEVKDAIKNMHNIMLSAEGNMWFAKATTAHRLRRWEAIRQDILKNLGSEPEGPAGKKIAQAWRELIDEQTGWAPPEFSLGMQMWQKLEQDQSALLEIKKAPTIVPDFDVAVKKAKAGYMAFALNVNATVWVFRALESHE